MTKKDDSPDDKAGAAAPGGALFDFYEKLHFNELETRDRLNGKFQLFITNAAALLGYLVTLINKVPFTAPCDWPPFVDAGMLAIALVLGSSYYFIRSYGRNSYQDSAQAWDIENYRRNLAARHQPPAEFDRYLLKNLLDVATHNAKTNEKRFERTRKGYELFLGALACALLASALYWGSAARSEQKPQSVIIAAPVRVEAPPVQPPAPRKKGHAS